jgi:hypothetical protein
LAYSSTLKVEVTGSFDTSDCLRNAWHYNPDHGVLFNSIIANNLKPVGKPLSCSVHSTLEEETKCENIIHEISRYILKSNQLKIDLIIAIMYMH